MATLDDLRGLGYEVGLSFGNVYRVEGFGLSTQVHDDDPDAIQSIIDNHDEAVAQQGETPAETQLRWHEDPARDFALPEEQVDRLREEVAAQRAAS